MHNKKKKKSFELERCATPTKFSTLRSVHGWPKLSHWWNALETVQLGLVWKPAGTRRQQYQVEISSSGLQLYDYEEENVDTALHK